MAKYTEIIGLCVTHPKCYLIRDSSDSSCPMHKYCFSPESDRREGESDADYTARVESYLCACYDSLVQEGVIKND